MALRVAIVYFDASVLVKLLAEEAGSDLAAQLRDGFDAALQEALPASPAQAGAQTRVVRPPPGQVLL